LFHFSKTIYTATVYSAQPQHDVYNWTAEDVQNFWFLSEQLAVYAPKFQRLGGTELASLSKEEF
jgi:hypothetical protein